MLTLFLLPSGGRLCTPDKQFEFPISGLTDAETAEHRRHMVYVNQANSLWPHLKIEENLQIVLRRVKGMDEKASRTRAKELLDALDLAHVAKRPTWEVSGGEARRVAVARALAVEPAIILLDEPDAGLDPIRSQVQTRLILSICQARATTAIVVSHNPAVIEECAEEVIVMSNGQAVETGPAQQVLEYPRHHETLALVQSAGWRKRSTRVANTPE